MLRSGVTTRSCLTHLRCKPLSRVRPSPRLRWRCRWPLNARRQGQVQPNYRPPTKQRWLLSEPRPAAPHGQHPPQKRPRLVVPTVATNRRRPWLHAINLHLRQPPPSRFSKTSWKCKAGLQLGYRHLRRLRRYRRWLCRVCASRATSFSYSHRAISPVPRRWTNCRQPSPKTAAPVYLQLQLKAI